MYDYYPSFSTAVAFTVLFGILLVAHFVEAFAFKVGFVWVLLMAVAWEFTGYLTRAFSTKHQQSDAWATATQLLVLLAPLCMYNSIFLPLFPSPPPLQTLASRDIPR
jgi:drug/metabolite transporter (DMT)-like permease